MIDSSIVHLPRRTLGHSGITVPVLGVGCWAIGGPDHNLGLPMGWSTQILEAGSPEMIRPLFDRPKADARAAKARLPLMPDLAKGASVQWPAGERGWTMRRGEPK